MSLNNTLLRTLLVGATLLAGCASGPRSRPESSPRVSDSVPDKVAAQRAVAGVHLEEDDARWGFTAARELKQRKEQKKAQQPGTPAAAGPVDLQQRAPAGAP
jgi:hypothetical protein